jgi:hypothetical protein
VEIRKVAVIVPVYNEQAAISHCQPRGCSLVCPGLSCDAGPFRKGLYETGGAGRTRSGWQPRIR